MVGSAERQLSVERGVGAVVVQVAASVEQLLGRLDSRRQLNRHSRCSTADARKGVAVAFQPVALFASISATVAQPPVMRRRARGASEEGTVVLVAAKTEESKGGKGAQNKGVVAASPAEQPSGWFGKMSGLEVLGNMMAGATAGAAVETALYPIDTIKTRLQAARKGQQIVWAGLYRGLAGNIVGVIPASALFFGVYEPTKQFMLRREKEGGSGFLAHLTAAAAAGTAASLVRVPTEVIKQRMQTGQFTSAVAAFRHILANEGVRKGLYAGYASFLLRDLPFDAIEFVAYEQLKLACSRVTKRDCRALEISAIGAGAGIATAVLTTPLDVIKTRLMTQGATGQYKGIIDCCTKIIREEGAGAMFKGVGPRVTWIGIGGSIFFTFLEGSRVVYLNALGVEQKEKKAGGH